MKENKNIILLVIAIIAFIVALAFLIWSFNTNNTSLKNQDSSKNNSDIINENIENNSDNEINEQINNSERQEDISNTQDVENVEYNDITVYTEDEKEVKLSDFSGTSAMLLFWNPENEDSVEVLKKVNEKYKKYEDKVKFLMISTSKEIPENIKNEISMEMYYDINNEYQEKYNVVTIPTMIYIYKDNTIMNAKSGVPSNDALEANLDLLSDNF